MDTQEHEYELGTLEGDILDRDESKARQGGSRGDERRWMILGGAGTLALLTAIVAAVSLGGTGEPHKLSASLSGPVRDLTALAAHLQTSAGATASATAAKVVAPVATPKARIARAQPPVQQPVVVAPVAATPKAPAPAAPTAPVSHAAVTAPAESSFANLPSVSATEEVAAGDVLDPAEVVPTNFEQDDEPFAQDPSESEDELAVPAEDDEAPDNSDADNDEDAEVDSPAAEEPAPANDVAVPAPTPA